MDLSLFRLPGRNARKIKPCVEELERRLVPSTICYANPTFAAECATLVALIPHSAITLTAQQTGNWSDPRTWGGRSPGNGDNVWIPNGITVTVDRQEPGSIRSILDNGVLQFAPDRNTSLLVDTLVVGTDDNPSGLPQGVLTIGTADNPIHANVTATLTFADDGTLAEVFPNDPKQLSRGLLSMNTTSIYGSRVTPYVAMANAHVGDITLQLSQVPDGWRVGDMLLLPGTSPTQNQDEQIAIAAISGRTVMLASPLLFAHAAPRADLQVYVADEARNVIIQSQNTTDATRFGHVMFMHTDQETIAYADLLNLGRTDKSQPINDPKFDANGQLVAGTGTNPRGRYALHFHRDYWPTLTQNDPPILVRGNYESGSPGWGYVNHSSNVDFENNVAYNNLGAGFATEAGNEIGTFNRNLSVYAKGSTNLNPLDRSNIQDFGQLGDGFWFQGAGITVTNNVATGQKDAGFMYFCLGLVENSTIGRTPYWSRNLVDPSIADGKDTIQDQYVPIRQCAGNQAYGSGTGLQFWYLGQNTPHPETVSVIQGFTSWGTKYQALFTYHSQNITTNKLVAIGNLLNPVPKAAVAFDESCVATFNNADVEGWATGISAASLLGQLTTGAALTVTGGYFNNVIGISVSAPEPDLIVRDIEINNVHFGTLSTAALAGRQQFDVYLSASGFNPNRRDLSVLFSNQIGTVSVDGQQLYLTQQDTDFIPYPTSNPARPWVPAGLIGKTIEQIWDQYGIALGGIVAPAQTTTNPRINGLLGARQDFQPTLQLWSRVYTNQLQNYQLVYRKLPAGQTSALIVNDSQLANLNAGWNFVTRVIDGLTRTFLIYGDVTPPTFKPYASQSFTVSQSAMSQPWLLQGTVTDDSTGNEYYARKFNLSGLPIQTRADGSRYLTISFTLRDLARNTATISYDITITGS